MEPKKWKLNTKKTQVVDEHGDEVLIGCDWRASNLSNLILASKAPGMLELLKDSIEIIKTLDIVCSDMLNELNNSREYKDFTKYSGFAREVEKFIKDINIV